MNYPDKTKFKAALDVQNQKSDADDLLKKSITAVADRTIYKHEYTAI
jgi:hypothetical protein